MNFAFLLRSIKTSAKGSWLMIEHEVVARKKLYQKCWGLKDLPLKIFLTFLKRGTKNRFLKENYFSIMLDFISAQIFYYLPTSMPATKNPIKLQFYRWFGLLRKWNIMINFIFCQLLFVDYVGEKVLSINTFSRLMEKDGCEILISYYSRGMTIISFVSQCKKHLKMFPEVWIRDRIYF